MREDKSKVGVRGIGLDILVSRPLCITTGYEHGTNHEFNKNRRAVIELGEALMKTNVSRNHHLGSERLSLDNHNILERPVPRISPSRTNPIHNIHSRDNLTEDSVLAVEMRRGSQGDEELAAVCAGPAVGHGQDALARVDERAVKLVLELCAVDRGAAAAGACRVAALDHEVGDDAVENDVVVFVGVGQGGKVLACLRDGISKDFRLWLGA